MHYCPVSDVLLSSYLTSMCVCVCIGGCLTILPSMFCSAIVGVGVNKDPDKAALLFSKACDKVHGKSGRGQF